MKKIVVVDDSESIQTLYSLELADEGYEVLTTRCDMAVFDHIEQEHPDLVVLDLKPDKCTNPRFLSNFRIVCGSTPIIFCLPFPGFQPTEESWGYEYSIVKSSDVSELKNKVKIALAVRNAGGRKATPSNTFLATLSSSSQCAAKALFVNAEE